MGFTSKKATVFFSTELDHTLRHRSFGMEIFWALFCYLRVLCSHVLKAHMTVEEDCRGRPVLLTDRGSRLPSFALCFGAMLLCSVAKLVRVVLPAGCPKGRLHLDVL